jgi:hypothetical protein
VRITTAVAAALVAALSVAGAQEKPPLVIRWVSPTADTYLAGPVLLRVIFDGEGGGTLVDDVTFFADGKQVCVVPGASAQCDWDAGAQLQSHALRVVARLKAGGRLVSSIRTKSAGYVESVSVDVVLATARRSACSTSRRSGRSPAFNRPTRPSNWCSRSTRAAAWPRRCRI